MKVYINQVYAAKTKIFNLSWPTFTLDVNSLIQMSVFTRPTSIELELYVGNFSFKRVCRFEVNVPGIFSETLTSSSSIFQEIDFASDNSDLLSKGEDISDTMQHKLNHSNSIQSQKNEEDVNLLGKESKQVITVNKEQKKEVVYKGTVVLKAEWEGYGKDMPPTKIEDQIALHKKQDNLKKQIRISNKSDYPFDLNDPRNIVHLESLKKQKTEMLLKYLHKEHKLQYYNVDSLRQFLLISRSEKSSLRNLQVPLLESEIDLNYKLQNIVKEIKENLKDKETTLTEKEIKIKEKIAKLNDFYSNRILTEDEYKELNSKKITTIKKDVNVRVHYNYYQIVSEFEQNLQAGAIIKEMLKNFFTVPRRLKPRKKLKTNFNLDKTKEIKINIHITKGYNIPARYEAIPSSLKEYLKAQGIADVYKSSSGAGNSMVGKLLRKELNLSLSQQNRNSNINNNNINQNMNNSYQSNNFNPYGTNNASLMGGINLNFQNQFNNNNNFGVNNMLNPNLSQMMYNPQGTPFPMYNNPNMYMPQSNFNSNLNNNKIVNNNVDNAANPAVYNGEILNMIDFFRNVEKNVESFIQAKLIYYDQEIELRTDTVEGLHPDYNSKLQFTIKPKNGNDIFTREDIVSNPGIIYFTLYDEIRTDHNLKEKGTNTYIYKYNRKYLGSFSIPFSTIFHNGNSMNAMSRVNIPMTVFGYYSDASANFDFLNGDNSIKNEKRNEEDINKLKSWKEGIFIFFN